MSARGAFFHLSKHAGLFALSSRACAKRLNILCYHGFSVEDEHLFRPSLFMTGQVFERRLQWLSRNGFRVLGLAEGLERLADGTLEPRSVVITIDDGFQSIGSVAVPLLERYRFPATVYVTTYYVVNRNPIFRLVVQYMFWKSGSPETETSDLVPAEHRSEAPLDTPIWRLIDYGERALDEPGRVELARELGGRIGVDYAEIVRRGGLTLLGDDAIRRLARAGYDIQLHTHRHRLPTDETELTLEIEENRAILTELSGRPADHLCYPSGIWDAAQWAALERAGVVSATTCDPGMNDAGVPALGLKRVLDRDDLPQIEFEAELCGFKAVARELRRS